MLLAAKRVKMVYVEGFLSYQNDGFLSKGIEVISWLQSNGIKFGKEELVPAILDSWEKRQTDTKVVNLAISDRRGH